MPKFCLLYYPFLGGYLPHEADRKLLQRFLEEQCLLVDQKITSPPPMICESVTQNVAKSAKIVAAEIHRVDLQTTPIMKQADQNQNFDSEPVDPVIARDLTFLKLDPSSLRLDLAGLNAENSHFDSTTVNPMNQACSTSQFKTGERAAPLAIPETLSSSCTSANRSPSMFKHFAEPNRNFFDSNPPDNEILGQNFSTQDRHSSLQSTTSFVTVKSYASVSPVGKDVDVQGFIERTSN